MSNRTARTLRPGVAQHRSPLLNCGKQTPPEASGKVAAGPDAEVIPLVTLSHAITLVAGSARTLAVHERAPSI
jgi:hypothetical protein